MQYIALPQDVIARLEGRWAKRLQQEAKAWSSAKPSMPAAGRSVVKQGRPSIPVSVKTVTPRPA